MVRFVAFAAILAASSPALAGHERGTWSHDPDRLTSAPRHGRTFVYFGPDGRWEPRAFSRDDGYFHGRGGGVSVVNRKALFDYDRDYPYDLPSWRAGGTDVGFADLPPAPRPACSIENVRDRRSGQSAEIRICR